MKKISHIQRKINFQSLWYAAIILGLILLAAGSVNSARADSSNEKKELDCSDCGHIEGYIWHDIDGNSQLGYGEPGITSVFVRLWKKQDNKVEIHRGFYTGPNGHYIFSDLAAGLYQLEVVEPHSKSLELFTQTEYLSPSPYLEVKPSEATLYNVGYAKNGPGKMSMSMSHTPAMKLKLPARYYHIGKYEPGVYFGPPKVYLNPYPRGLKNEPGKKARGERFTNEDIKGIEGNR